MAAYAECKCKKCKIKFLQGKAPIFRIGCCCVDCNGARDYCTSKGGLCNGGLFQDGYYYDNDIEVMSGENDLTFFKMKEDYDTVRGGCKHCNTHLLSWNPIYGGLIAMTVSDVLHDFDSKCPNLGFIYAKDIPKKTGMSKAEADAALKKAEPTMDIQQEISPGQLAEFGALLGPSGERQQKRKGVTLESLIEKIGVRVPSDMSQKYLDSTSGTVPVFTGMKQAEQKKKILSEASCLEYLGVWKSTQSLNFWMTFGSGACAIVSVLAFGRSCLC